MSHADPEAILAALDPEQRAVATSLEGPVVVLAGAGTGKTRALTHRLAYAAAIGRYDPRATLAVTFTTRAAGELRDRLRRLGVPKVNARTFHSAALKQAQYFWPRALGTDLPEVTDRRFAIVAEAAGRVGLEADTGLLRDLVTEVGWAKVSNVAPDDYPAKAAEAFREVSGADHATVARVLGRYEEVKRRRGVIDFDDILLCTVALLADNPGVLDEVRRTYRHFVVDEYQDVSPLQQQLLDLWVGDRPDLCVVGDAEQTIHTFAGAQSRYLTRFAVRHPGATTVRLVRDYRSTPEVVRVANGIAGRTRPGALGALQSQRPSGPAVVFEGATNEAGEAAAAAAWLRQLHRDGVPWSDMAILYRVHAQSPPLEVALGALGIPFRTRDDAGFFQRSEVRQALIGFRQRASTDAEGSLRSHLENVLSGLGWQPDQPRSAGAALERWESWNSLLDMADDVVSEAPEADLRAFLAEVDRRTEYEQAPDGDAVTLATLHAAKGLEWDAVALYGIHEGSMPFSLATRPEQIAEEQRLLYVGVTRAKTHLRVSWASARTGASGSRRPSRFLTSVLPKDVVVPARPNAKAQTLLNAVCRVCQRPVTTPAERKLRRHESCPGTHDEAAMERLTTWRREEAARQKLPAYCVFTDATLLAIAEAAPNGPSELARLPGIGKIKLERYGPTVLALLMGAEPPS